MRIQPVVASVLAVVLVLVPVSAIAQPTSETVYLPLITVGGVSTEGAHQAERAPANPPATSVGPDRLVTVMTRNLYFGADLAPVLAASTLPEFLAAVAGVYQSAVATNFPERAGAISHEIATTQPLLIGLQEVALWRTGALNDPAPAADVVYDFVQLLLDQLAARGLHYEAIALAQGFDAEVPLITGGVDVRLTVHDVVLARTDLKVSDLRILNVQTGSYSAALTLPLPEPLGNFIVPRNWVAVDVKVRGKQFRFITTHLEPFALPIRQAQALQLLSGPAITPLPVVLVGDINSQPSVPGDAADILISSGFVDVWAALHPDDPGYTCCQDAGLLNDASLLDQRIDLVLVRGGIVGTEATLLGDEPDDKTTSGLWPSDHAGVAATVRLPVCAAPDRAGC